MVGVNIIVAVSAIVEVDVIVGATVLAGISAAVPVGAAVGMEEAIREEAAAPTDETSWATTNRMAMSAAAMLRDARAPLAYAIKVMGASCLKRGAREFRSYSAARLLSCAFFSAVSLSLRSPW